MGDTRDSKGSTSIFYLNTFGDMARGRGGHGRRGGRGERGGRLHSTIRTSDNIVSDSNINVDHNATSIENVNVTNSGSRSNNDSLLNQPLGDERIELHVVKEVLDNSSTCSRVITKIFKEKIDAEGYTWTKVSRESKDFYFGEFKKIFVWDPLSEMKIREAWDKKAAQRYTDLTWDIRAKMVKPGFITDGAWTNFTAYWGLPGYKKKQEITRANRLKGEGSSTHKGGSISFPEHAKNLEAKLGRPSIEFELFLYTHTKDHDKITFINARSKEVNDNMLRLREEHLANHEFGQIESQEIDESTLFYEAVGGKRKKGVCGNGSNVFNLLNPKCNLNATTSKLDGTSRNKDLTMEKKLRKITKENNSLKHTIGLLCKHVGVPTTEFDPDSKNEDNGEESECDVHQQHTSSDDAANTSHSQGGPSHEH